MLDANPNLKYLFPVVDGMAPLVTPAVGASHGHVSVITVNATPGVAMSAVKSGVFAAQAGSSETMTGWYAFDAAARAILKLAPETDPNQPVSFFTTAEMKQKNLNPSDPTSLFGDAFQAGFLKLWGVG
jgi:ABC-type sugar transport system substrate-binding protein